MDENTKKVFSIYKIPLLISLTLSIILIALRIVRQPLDIASIFLGALAGSFVLDLEYFIYAYFLEPEKDFSKTLVAFVKHKDFQNALLYIDYHKDELKDKTLNSVLFQIVIALICIFIVPSAGGYFVKALVLSIFVNSIYRLMEYYHTSKLDEWFWELKSKPTKQGTILYTLGLLAILAYCLSIF